MPRSVISPRSFGLLLALFASCACGKLAGLDGYEVGSAGGTGSGGSGDLVCGGVTFAGTACHTCMQACCGALEE